MTRQQAEALYGPIKTVCNCPPIPWRKFDWSAYFYDRLDLGAPGWITADGETEAEALATLLMQAEEHYPEENEPAFAKGMSDLRSVIERLL